MNHSCKDISKQLGKEPENLHPVYPNFQTKPKTMSNTPPENRQIKAYSGIHAFPLHKETDFTFAYKNMLDKIVRCNITGFSKHGFHVINERGVLVIVKHDNLFKPSNNDWVQVTYLSVKVFDTKLIVNGLLK